MKFRQVVIFTGKRFRVPQGIQRIDVRYTHGWQLRYGGTRFFKDGSADGRGAAAALARAKEELLRRIERLPAPSLLQSAPSRHKTSELPVGISGPIVRLRQGATVRYCSLSVLLPQHGAKPRRSSIYIGTENTYTVERYHQALARAMALRQRAEQAYRRAATRAKRAQAQALRPRATARKASCG